MRKGPDVKLAEGTSSAFSTRFFDRKLAERYRDRFADGRHARVDQSERVALRRLLALLKPIRSAMDIPCGVGRLSRELTTAARQLIVADASPIMLDMAREALADVEAEYRVTKCESIDLPNKAVDLIFCHRFFHHLDLPEERRCVLSEFARVSAHYVVINHYSPGLRSRLKRLFRSFFSRGARSGKLGSANALKEEARNVGLCWVQTVRIRRFPAHGRFMIFTVPMSGDAGAFQNESECAGWPPSSTRQI